MSDDLAVGGPGTTSVLTTELVEEAMRLAQLGWELKDCRRELGALDRMVGNGILNAADAPRSAMIAEQAIDNATAALRNAEEHCDQLVRGLAHAADGYEFADRVVGQLEQQAAADLGYFLGVILPVIGAVIVPIALVAGAGFALFVSTLPERSRAALFSSAGAWLRSHSSGMTDPNFVTAVRYSVMSADDVGMGTARVPAPIASLLGDEGLGLLSVDTSAAALAGAAGGLGLLRETPVRVTAGPTAHGLSNAEQIQDRVERIPKEPDQVRIDTYSSPGTPDRFEVYIAGTADLGAAGDGEPWDMASNIVAMGGGSDGSNAGSYRSVVQAMVLAGIDSHSPVTFTGYSQGGLIAAQLVASGDYAVDGLVTLGAPAGQVAVPHDIPYLAIEHTDDLVTALGGTFTSSDPVVASRRVFDSPPPFGGFVLPAHQLSNYLDTAGLVDGSDNLRLHDVVSQLSHPYAPSVTSTVFRADRINR